MCIKIYATAAPPFEAGGPGREGSQEHVLGLEVAIDDVHAVQILERQHNLRRVEAHPLLRQPSRRRQVRVQVPPSDQVHDQTELQPAAAVTAQRPLPNAGARGSIALARERSCRPARGAPFAHAASGEAWPCI